MSVKRRSDLKIDYSGRIEYGSWNVDSNPDGLAALNKWFKW